MSTRVDSGTFVSRFVARGRHRLRWLGYHLGVVISNYSRYARLMRLHRPIGIWLLLWPTLWALWIAAAGRPDAPPTSS
jgi:hypothetical protein